MKNYFYLFALLSLFSSCNDDSLELEPTNDLVSPEIVTVTEYNTQFTGALTVYPCDVTSSVYAGNYTGSPLKLSIFPANYLISKNGYIKSAPPLFLPLGSHTLVYWGVPLSNTPSYSTPSSNEPPLTFQTVLKEQQISLRPITPNSPICYPVYDYVYGRQEIKIGADKLDINLKRAVGGLVIQMANSDNTAFDASITSIVITIDNIAKSVNFYTGEPSTEQASVRFPLTIASDRMSATNETVMLFPSVSTPNITIEIHLRDGSVKDYTKATSSIVANNKLTVTVNVSPVIHSPGDGSLTVDEWTESKDIIAI